MATLEAVAAAPCTLGKKKPRRKRSFARLALIAVAMLSIPSTMLFVTPKAAQAGFDVPEIDPTSMAGALTLLVGGVLVLTDRNRRV
jgi:hypothetical protein